MQASSVADPRPFRATITVAAMLLLALLVVAGVKSFRDLEAARSRQAQLEERIAEAQGKIDRLRIQVDRLEDDPLTMERRAREDLWLARPGDVVIVLPNTFEESAAAPAPVTPNGAESL